MNDEELIQVLKNSVGPTPDWMRRATDLAWETRDFDARLADLVNDSRSTTGVRSSTTHEHALVFAAGDSEMVVSIRSSNDQVDSVSVWLEGPGADDELTVTMEAANRDHIAVVGSQTMNDPMAIATFSAPIGRALRVTVSTAGQRYATPWFHPDDDPDDQRS